MKERKKTVDIVILMFASTICFVVVVVTISPLVTGRFLSDAKGDAFVQLLYQILGAVLIYVGAIMQRNYNNHKTKKE